MIEIRTQDGHVVRRIIESEPEQPSRDRSWVTTELVDATPRQQRRHRVEEDFRVTPNLTMYGQWLYVAGEPTHYHSQPVE